MINEQSGGQTNLPTSSSMSYGYPAGHFERLNMQPIRSPTDSYSYYPPNMYQGFGTFEESNQFAPADLAASLGSAPGPMTYHPSIYTPSPPFDISHNVFDYSSVPNPYSHYHPMGFNHAANFSGPTSSTPVTNFDVFWSPHNLSHQQQQQQQQQQSISMGPIQTTVPSTASLNSMANDKPTSYDPYLSSTSSRLPDILAQRMNLMQLANTPMSHDVYQQYHAAPNEAGSNVGKFSPNQAAFTSLSNNGSSSTSNYQKSYALVVSSDSTTRNSVKQTSINPNHSNSNPNWLLNNGNLSQQQASGYQKNVHAEQNSFSASSDYHNSNPTVKLSERSMNNNDGVNRRQISGRHKSATKGENSNQEALGNLVQQHQYNPKQFNLNPKGARFFVIKSYSEDDVHRSIKYKIWCSTEHGNKRLDTAYREREGKGPVYLFFSVNGSGHFCGMAEMTSPVDYEHKTDVWHMSNKWQGKFEVKWIYVKDVPNQQFRHIRLENNENKPVTNSRDTQEVLYEKGKLVLKVLHFYQHKTSIFDDFFYYESKQVEEDTKKSNIDEWHEN